MAISSMLQNHGSPGPFHKQPLVFLERFCLLFDYLLCFGSFTRGSTRIGFTPLSARIIPMRVGPPVSTPALGAGAAFFPFLGLLLDHRHRLDAAAQYGDLTRLWNRKGEFSSFITAQSVASIGD